jgi:hypothetical protein
VVCDTDAVSGESNIVQRLTKRNQERRASARRGRRNAQQRRSFPTAGLRQPLLNRATNIHCKARACRCTNARAQERRASARRGRRYRRHARKVEHSTATSEHAPRSGGRQPAVVGETPMQRRSFPTAGLRQPLLIGRRTFTAKRVLADAQTHVPRSGGREPPVVCDTDAVPRKSNIAQRLANTQPGAVDVSPPWCAMPTLCRENRTSHSD